MKIKRTAVIVLIAVIFVSTLAFAEDGTKFDGSSNALRYDLKLDVAVTSIAAAGWIISSAAQNQIAPSHCHWCDVDSFDKWGYDNLKWSNSGAANKAVYVTGYALAPMIAFGLDALAAERDGDMSNFWVDALVIAEATAISCLVSQVFKFATGRERPYAHYGGANSPSDNMSFYSGHTTFAFSLAVSSGTVATMRGYDLAPWIWGSGLAVAATTGYLSIASNRHYLTDVITGAVAGSAFGFGIPYLFHRPRSEDKQSVSFSMLPIAQGGLLSVNGEW